MLAKLKSLISQKILFVFVTLIASQNAFATSHFSRTFVGAKAQSDYTIWSNWILISLQGVPHKELNVTSTVDSDKNVIGTVTFTFNPHFKTNDEEIVQEGILDRKIYKIKTQLKICSEKQIKICDQNEKNGIPYQSEFPLKSDKSLLDPADCGSTNRNIRNKLIEDLKTINKTEYKSLFQGG